MLDKNLKPCPCCKSKEISIKCNSFVGVPVSLVGKKYWFVECLDCDLNTGKVFEDDVDVIYQGLNLTAREIVIAKWNRRE